MNHKWKNDAVLSNEKTDVCVKCGVRREWCRGNYQCWEYWWVERFTAQNGESGMSVIKSFTRPECKPKPLETEEEKINRIMAEEYRNHGHGAMM